jgi:hypothetical protein
VVQLAGGAREGNSMESSMRPGECRHGSAAMAFYVETCWGGGTFANCCTDGACKKQAVGEL